MEYLDAYRRGLPIIGKEIGLAPADALNPEAIADEWPTPGVMIYGRPSRGVQPFISGTRLDVLRETYRNHYPHQSAQAHGRIAALAAALLVDDPDSQWNPGYGESNIVLTALLFLACILSELEIAGRYQRHPKLARASPIARSRFLVSLASLSWRPCFSLWCCGRLIADVQPPNVWILASRRRPQRNTLRHCAQFPER